MYIKKENKIPIFKLDTKFENRNLKNNKIGETKKIINYSYINSFSNGVINNNDNYLNKIHKLPKRKTELILKNIKKLGQNKNKPNFINIINNNNINNNINMLIKIQPKSEIRRKNSGLNTTTKIFKINDKTKDIFIRNNLEKLKHRPISTKVDIFHSTKKIL